MTTATTSPQILLTGATGYIGGTILHALLDGSSPALSKATITCLVRGKDRASTLSSTYGDRVKPVVYKDLDDVETTTAVAAQHDIVINTTPGFHAASAQALLRGLAQRKKSTGKDVWMIHTSGTSNLGDLPTSGGWKEEVPDREFDDAKDDIYGYEQMREAHHPYLQRTTELGTIDLGLELGVKTLVIMSPTIYGFGTGLFNNSSIQIPIYVRGALKQGHGVVIGEGTGTWDHVHVEDLAELYKLVVLQISEKAGAELPTGKKGIIFSGNGRHSWMEVAQAVADVCHEEGKIPSKHVEKVGLSEGVKILAMYPGELDEETAEPGLASNSRTVSNVARSLGWKPTRGEEAWKKDLQDTVKDVLKQA